MSESRNSEKNGAPTTSREATRERWRGVVAEQRTSGESMRGFCRGRGISYGRFLAWAKRFGDSGDGCRSGRFAVDELPRPAAGFREVRVGAPGGVGFPVAGWAYEIAAGGVVVRVGSGFDEGEVARLLRAVFEASRLLGESVPSFGGAARSAADPSRSTASSTRPAGEASRPC